VIAPSTDNLFFWATYWRDLYATLRAWAHKGEKMIHAFEDVASALSVVGSIEDDGDSINRKRYQPVRLWGEQAFTQLR
jgi:hypothetical protein